MDIHLHDYRTLHVGDKYHLLCPLRGARKHANVHVVHDVAVDHLEIDLNSM